MRLSSGNLLIGIHAVTEALRARQTLDRVMIARGAKNPRLDPIAEECRRRGVALLYEPRDALDRLAPGANHQGVVAVPLGSRPADLKGLLETLEAPGLVVVLDGVEDPHNLGAIIRSAYAAGADAVVIPQRRAAGLSEAVSKAAAGALEYLPVIRVKSLNGVLERLKENDFWIYGLDEEAQQPHTEPDYAGNVALVLGGEGTGLNRLTAKKCDFLVRIPVAGRIASLNVSVAAGVVLFEVLRRRTEP